jgi:hypothetical protein
VQSTLELKELLLEWLLELLLLELELDDDELLEKVPLEDELDELLELELLEELELQNFVTISSKFP